MPDLVALQEIEWSPEALAAFSEGFCPDCRTELVKSWAICPACNTAWWLTRKGDPSSLVGIRSRREESNDETEGDLPPESGGSVTVVEFMSSPMPTEGDDA